jgi:hypothetical protein
MPFSRLAVQGTRTNSDKEPEMAETSPAPHKSVPWRLIGWGGIALLLSLPAILRFPWTLSDFVIMGILLGSVGLAVEFLMRLGGGPFVRLGAILVVLTCFLTIWVNLAVGMIGDDNPYNLYFALVIFTAAIGSVLVRFDPRRTAAVMVLAAFLQVAIGLGGYGQDPRGAFLSAMFGGLWLLAAALFRAGASR